jgi:hypothetical protein
MKLSPCVLGLCLVFSLVRAQDHDQFWSEVASSSNKAIKIYQFDKTPADGGYFFTYIVSEGDNNWHLNDKDAPEDAAYPADFRFSTDNKWLVRSQKIAAGESTLFLYHRTADGYVPATPKRFGDMAWDFFFAQPEAKGIDHGNLSPETILVRGMADNYAWMGEHWPDSRYIVIGLGSGESGTTPIGPWHCVYDTRTGAFSIPPDIAAFNKSKMPWK